MSSTWTPNSKYTITIQGLTDLDGNVMEPFESFFFSTFSPVWVNLDIIRMDLRGYVESVSDYTLMTYAHLASMEAYRAMKANTAVTTPDPSKTIDELCEAGFNTSLLAYMECFVRWKTQYDLLVNALAKSAAASGVQKTLGDFSVKLSASPNTIAEALDHHIVPKMNECFLPLAGEQNNKGGPRVVLRGSSEESVMATIRGRSFYRPGFKQHRNWDWGPQPPGRRLR